MKKIRATRLVPVMLCALLSTTEPLSAADVQSLSPADQTGSLHIRLSAPAAACSVLSFKTAESPAQERLRASSGLGSLSAGIAGSFSFTGLDAPDNESSMFSFSFVPAAFLSLAGDHSAGSCSTVAIRECFVKFSSYAPVFSGAPLRYSFFIGRSATQPEGFEYLYGAEPLAFFGGESAMPEDRLSVSITRDALSVSAQVLPFAPDFFGSDPAGPLVDRREVLDEFTTTGLLGTTYQLDSIGYNDESLKEFRAFSLDPSAALRAAWKAHRYTLSASVYAGRDRQPAMLSRFLSLAAVSNTYKLEVQPVASRIIAFSAAAEFRSGVYSLSFVSSYIAGRTYASSSLYDPIYWGVFIPAVSNGTVLSHGRLELDPFRNGVLHLSGEWFHSLYPEDPGNMRYPFMHRYMRASAVVHLPRFAGLAVSGFCEYALSLADGSSLVSPAVRFLTATGASAELRYTAPYGETDTELGQFAQNGTVWLSILFRCP